MRTYAWWVAPAGLLAGCWLDASELDAKLATEPPVAGDTDPVVDDEVEDPALPELVLSSVAPDGGSNAGVGEVVLTVQGLVDSPVVMFGNTLATVRSVEDDQVTVKVPASVGEGWVAVEVTDSDRSSRLEQGFRYWADGLGRTGLYGEVAWFDMVGGYWDGPPEDSGEAWLSFAKPGDHAITAEYGVALDDCESGYEPPPIPNSYSLELPAVRLVPPTGSPLELELEEGRFTASFDAPGWSGGEVWGFTSDALNGWPALTLSPLFTMPGAFELTSPAIDGLEAVAVSRSNLHLAWNGPYDGEFVVAHLLRYGTTGPAESVVCLLRDDGQFKVPSTVWEGWTIGSQLTLIVGRARASEATLPHNRANVGAVAIRYTMGAVVTGF